MYSGRTRLPGDDDDGGVRTGAAGGAYHGFAGSAADPAAAAGAGVVSTSAGTSAGSLVGSGSGCVASSTGSSATGAAAAAGGAFGAGGAQLCSVLFAPDTLSFALLAVSLTAVAASCAVSLTADVTFFVVRFATRLGLTFSAIASSVSARSSRVLSISAARAAGSGRASGPGSDLAARAARFFGAAGVAVPAVGGTAVPAL